MTYSIGGEFLRSSRSPVVAIRGGGILNEFDYEVDYEQPSHPDGRVVVIYAENGMGKTNFLKAVHHILSPRIASLRTLAELLIDSLEVTLENGTKVSLARGVAPDAILRLAIERANQSASGSDQETAEPDRVQLNVSQDDVDADRVRHANPRPEVTEYLKELRRSVSAPILVGDDRLVHGGAENTMSARRRYDFDRENNLHRNRGTSLKETLDFVERYLTRTTLAGISRDPSGDANGVYSEITKRVLAGKTKVGGSEARESLTSQVEKLLAQAGAYEKYGMLPFGEIRRIQRQCTSARANNRNFPSLQRILAPYLSDMEDRVEALAPAQRLIASYVTSVNRFLQRKRLEFSAPNGITLIGRGGEELEAEGLSSGEKHLLLLLSNALLARQTDALVIIDEPELSLGLTWQRQLVSELLRCTDGSGVQFLIASHSVQIMNDIDEVVRPTEMNSLA